MNKPLADDLIQLFQQFQFLIVEHGFHVVSSDVSPSFDNMFVQATNGEFNIRIVRDRGFEYAEVSPQFAPSEWLGIGQLRQLALATDPSKDINLTEEAEFLRLRYTTVAEMISAANLEKTVMQINKVCSDRLEKLFPGCIRN